MNTESEPYIKAFKRDCSTKLKIVGSIRQSRDFVFHWKGISNARKKCFIVPISVPQLHMGLSQPLNLWQNFCFLKWLNFSCSLLSNFTPFCSYIENSDLCFDMKNYIDLNYLTDLAPHMEFPKLFDSLTQKGKKEYVSLSVLYQIIFKLFLFAAWVWSLGGHLSIWSV